MLFPTVLWNEKHNTPFRSFPVFVLFNNEFRKGRCFSELVIKNELIPRGATVGASIAEGRRSIVLSVKHVLGVNKI